MNVGGGEVELWVSFHDVGESVGAVLISTIRRESAQPTKGNNKSTHEVSCGLRLSSQRLLGSLPPDQDLLLALHHPRPPLLPLLRTEPFDILLENVENLLQVVVHASDERVSKDGGDSDDLELRTGESEEEG